MRYRDKYILAMLASTGFIAVAALADHFWLEPALHAADRQAVVAGAAKASPTPQTQQRDTHQPS